jgi:hypothetical protein
VLRDERRAGRIIERQRQLAGAERREGGRIP